MPLSTDQHPCARGDRCKARTITVIDGQRQAVPAWTYRTYCDPCRDHVGTTLADLPAMYVRVHGELGNRTGGGERVTVSKTPPVPLSLGVDALLREVVTVLLSWEERVRDVARLTTLDTLASRRRPDGALLDGACRLLGAHLDALLALAPGPMLRVKTIPQAASLPPGTRGVVRPGAGYAEVILDLCGADAGGEILRLHARCAGLLTETRAPARHLPVPCDWCSYAELYEVLTWDGRPDGARCRECGYEYSDNEYTLLRGRVYAEETARAGAYPRRRLVVAEYGGLSGRTPAGSAVVPDNDERMTA
ncbi:hypothetical protein AB0C10_37680 [Microbispora amethystogenes]|uniref:hypothetical protein n=1 Tax=Microbispora amethystogenes TaxID=1427754 RepID=UPI0033FC96D8